MEIENPVRRYSSGPVSLMTPIAARCLRMRARGSRTILAHADIEVGMEAAHTQYPLADPGRRCKLSCRLGPVIPRQRREKIQVYSYLNGRVKRALRDVNKKTRAKRD